MSAERCPSNARILAADCPICVVSNLSLATPRSGDERSVPRPVPSPGSGTDPDLTGLAVGSQSPDARHARSATGAQRPASPVYTALIWALLTAFTITVFFLLALAIRAAYQAA